MARAWSWMARVSTATMGSNATTLPLILRIDGATLPSPMLFREAVYAYDSTRQHRSPGNLPRYWFESQVLEQGWE